MPQKWGQKWGKSAAKNRTDFAADLFIIFYLCVVKVKCRTNVFFIFFPAKSQTKVRQKRWILGDFEIALFTSE